MSTRLLPEFVIAIFTKKKKKRIKNLEIDLTMRSTMVSHQSKKKTKRTPTSENISSRYTHI